ncbi:DUF3027 domain-containing protein [Amycolatopsis vancoresmycina]|uniref:DUF3027 domain-containing protein n=1 Tax=Amycolatopsis vancoresmycina TaxID=208444 RepID=UPI0005269F8C
MTLLLTLDDGSVQRKLADAVEFARAAVLEDAPEEQLGGHVGVTREDAVTASHLFEAQVPGYGGWRWSVTVALAGDDEPVTVSEVVLVPGPSALVAPAWVPWERRVRAGDLGVGDIFPTDENDPRLAPAYLQSDDPAVEETAREAGLGRVHTLSRFGRTEAAARWHAGEFGPRSDMARSAPDVCGTCGFFVPLAGSLRGVFGVCSNDIAPADGHVVDVEYGCGAHSEVEVEVTSSVPVAELVYDDSLLDFAPAPEVVEAAAAEGETGVAESDVSPAEVEPEVAAEVAPAAAVAEAPAEPAGVAAAPAEAELPAAEPVVAEPAEFAATPVEAEPAVAEPVAAEIAEAPVEVAAASEPVEAPVAPAAAEPVAAEAEPVGAVAEPVAQATPAAADEVAEPVQAEATDAAEAGATPEPSEAPEPVVAEGLEAERAAEAEPAGAVAEPVEQATPADEVAEPVQADVTDAAEALTAPEPVVAEVPEPAEAEPTQAEVTDAAGLSAAPEAAEPVAVEVPEPAEAEPTQAEVTDVGDLATAPAVAEPVAPEASEPAPAVGEVPEPAEAEPSQAEVTDAVDRGALDGETSAVTEPAQPDEAQAQLDTDR